MYVTAITLAGTRALAHATEFHALEEKLKKIRYGKVRTGLFPWKKLLIVVMVIISGIVLMIVISSQLLKGVSNNFGTSVEKIRLPDVEK